MAKAKSNLADELLAEAVAKTPKNSGIPWYKKVDPELLEAINSVIDLYNAGEAPFSLAAFRRSLRDNRGLALGDTALKEYARLRGGQCGKS